MNILAQERLADGDKQANELLKGAGMSKNARLDSGEPATSPSAGAPTLHSIFGETRISGSSLPVQRLVGNQVGLVIYGREIATGTMDMVTDDGSTVWVWLDGGGGRRMIHAGDGIDLRALETATPVRPAPSIDESTTRIQELAR